jgi:branched-chain amino acid transport system substrate-binding protein
MDAAPIYAKAGVVQLVPTVTLIELTRQNSGTIFRIAVTDEQEARALGAYFARENRSKKVTVAYSDYRYRRAMAEMVRLALPAEMMASTRFEPLRDASGAADRLVDKLQREPQDIIYMALDAAPAVEFVRKLRTRGVKSLLMGGQQLLTEVFWRGVGAGAEGVHVIAPIESLNRSEFRSAVSQLKQAGVVPDLVAIYSYVAVQVWAEAVRQAGGGDPKKVVEALRSVEFPTAIGRVAFDQTGDRRDPSYSVVTWKAGPLTELRTVQEGAVITRPAAVPPDISQPATTTDILRFDEPLPFGPFPVNGNSIKQLADSVPLFPPIEGQNDPLWKKNCSNCHKWDRQSLCQQGATYVANPQNVLRLQHPYGGPFKVALMRWSQSGYQ